jgi:hypothetical protein
LSASADTAPKSRRRPTRSIWVEAYTDKASGVAAARCNVAVFLTEGSAVLLHGPTESQRCDLPDDGSAHPGVDGECIYRLSVPVDASLTEAVAVLGSALFLVGEARAARIRGAIALSLAALMRRERNAQQRQGGPR